MSGNWGQGGTDMRVTQMRSLGPARPRADPSVRLLQHQRGPVTSDKRQPEGPACGRRCSGVSRAGEGASLPAQPDLGMADAG